MYRFTHQPFPLSTPILGLSFLLFLPFLSSSSALCYLFEVGSALVNKEVQGHSRRGLVLSTPWVAWFISKTQSLQGGVRSESLWELWEMLQRSCSGVLGFRLGPAFTLQMGEPKGLPHGKRKCDIFSIICKGLQADRCTFWDHQETQDAFLASQNTAISPSLFLSLSLPHMHTLTLSDI